MDAGEKLQSILSSPDGMEKLQEAAKQLQGALGEGGDLSGILQSFAGSLPAAPEKKGGMDLSLLVNNYVKGEEGSQLTITVYRENSDEYKDITLTRRPIDVQTV